MSNDDAPRVGQDARARIKQLATNLITDSRRRAARRRAFDRLLRAEARMRPGFNHVLSLRLDELMQDLESLGGRVDLLPRGRPEMTLEGAA